MHSLAFHGLSCWTGTGGWCWLGSAAAETSSVCITLNTFRAMAARETIWSCSSQVLLRFPWCLQMVQCLQSMCLLDTFHRYPFYASPGRRSSCLENLLHALVCFLLDHRGERCAAGSGVTSATRVPPGGPLPSPPPSTSSPCPLACLHPAPRHDAPAAPLVRRHGGRRGRHELPVHLAVPSSSCLLRAGWGVIY